MKNQTLLCLLSAFMLLVGLQCPKDTSIPQQPTQPNGLPLETQDGKNTFGCFWNDTLWLPIGGIGGPAIICSYYNDSNWLSMSMYNEVKKETISLNFLINDTGSYKFYDLYPNKVEILKNIVIWNLYKCIEQKPLSIYIKKFIKSYTDGNKRVIGIVSGNFSGIFYKQNSSGIGVDLTDSITISKAIFDLKVY